MKLLRISVITALLVLVSIPPVKAEMFPDPLNVSVSVSVPDTRVTFFGVTAPNAFVTFVDNAVIVGTAVANSSGGFTKTLTNQDPGIHSFGIHSQDTEGNTTPTYSFVINLILKTETIISNIVLPPTIQLSKTTFAQNEIVPISGQAPPNSTVSVFVQSELHTETRTANSLGRYALDFDKTLELGTHSTYSKVSNSGGGQSIFSVTKEFIVVAAPTPTPTPIPTGCTTDADINNDGSVSLPDFSIMLYDWESNANRSDLNCDDIVNLVDFSILLARWS